AGRTSCRSRVQRSTNRASTSTSRRRPTTRSLGSSRSATSRARRAFVLSSCVYQRASSYPDGVPIADGPDLVGRGGSAIVGPDGEYLAGPLWDEEGVLGAELDPELLFTERQRFDPAGDYSRPGVL